MEIPHEFIASCKCGNLPDHIFFYENGSTRTFYSPCHCVVDGTGKMPAIPMDIAFELGAQELKTVLDMAAMISGDWKGHGYGHASYYIDEKNEVIRYISDNLAIDDPADYLRYSIDDFIVNHLMGILCEDFSKGAIIIRMLYDAYPIY